MTACGSGSSSGKQGEQKNPPKTEENLKDIVFEKDDYQQMIRPNNELGFKLMNEIAKEDKENLFISPTSLFIALSMIYNGADGHTKEEIAEALQMDQVEVEALNKANASLLANLKKDSDAIQLNIANSIWLNEQFHFQQKFANKNEGYFNAEIQEINIQDADAAREINDWVKQATNDKIKEMVEPPLNPDMVALLLNAIYFRGDWSHPFDEAATENAAFYLKGGETKDVPFMTLTEELLYMENDQFQAVTLPYGDGEMNMKVFLPKANVDLAQFMEDLTLDHWSAWNKSFELKKGTVTLPKFQLEYEVVLNDVLQQLGMKSAFDDQANFSKMIQEDNPVWMSIVKQKSFIDVNEKGTEAAAVTGTEFETTALPLNEPFSMEVNRPFFIAITDEETDAILFMGKIINPAEEK